MKVCLKFVTTCTYISIKDPRKPVSSTFKTVRHYETAKIAKCWCSLDGPEFEYKRDFNFVFMNSGKTIKVDFLFNYFLLLFSSRIHTRSSDL